MATTPGRVVRTLRHDLGRLTNVVRVLVRNQELLVAELGALKRRVGGDDEPPPATTVIPIRSLRERRESRGRGGVRLAAAVALAGLLLFGVIPQVGPGGRPPSAQAVGTLPDPRPPRNHPTTTSGGGAAGGSWTGRQPGRPAASSGPAATVQAARAAAQPAAVASSATEPAGAPPTTSTTLPEPTTTTTVELPTTTLCVPVQRHDCKPDD